MLKHHAPIKSELAKMSFVLLVVLALGIWQNHFIIEGVLSNIYLNGIIFAAAGFGIYNVFSQTMSLSNEHLALAALKQHYDDALRAHLDPEDDRRWRYFRLSEPAIVYSMPTVLGHAHNLILEEINRTGFVRIPTSTMSVLVEDIENKLGDKTTLTTYMGALMVLLGLMGTFIGLMETLASVGGILGSLDLSGSAGAGAIQGLIEGLKKPLNGMATGFSSSLFGLLGSLVIGLLAKLDAVAVGKLKREVEDFLGKVAQIEASVGASGPAHGTHAGSAPGLVLSETEASHLRLMLRVARTTVTSTARMAQQIDALVKAVDGLRTDGVDHREETRRLSASLERLQAVHAAIGSTLAADSRAIVASNSRLVDVVERLDGTVVEEVKVRRELTQAVGTGFRDLETVLRLQLTHLSDLQTRTGRIETAVETTGSDSAAMLRQIQAATVIGSEPDTDDLLAKIDAVIAGARLSPQEVKRLRTISGLVEEGGSVDDLRQRLAAVWPTAEGPPADPAEDEFGLFTSTRTAG